MSKTHTDIVTDCGGTFKQLDDVSRSGYQRPWQAHRQASLRLASLYEFANQILPLPCPLLTPKRLRDLYECGETLEFALFADGRKELRRAWFCRVRLCPMCMWRRSLKFAGKAKRAVDSVKRDFPTARFLFVTFTQRNCSGSELGDALSKMTSSFSKVMKDKRLGKSLLGYMRSIEVTVNKQDWTCHPHIHAILAVRADYFTRGYIKQSEWREMWRAAMGLDYLPQVNVKPLKGSDWAIAEAAKYAVKSVDTLADSPDKVAAARMLADLTIALHKRRLVSFGGAFRRVKFDDTDYDSGDLVHVEGTSGDDEIGRVVYRWSPMLGVYVEDVRKR